MVPWPIALLALLYVTIATAAASSVWQIVTGVSHRPLLWQLVWLGLSAGAVCGLASMKSWGRALAIWTSTLLMVVLLSFAGLLALAAHEPFLGLVMAILAGLQMVAIRYLQRPMVKAWFEKPTI